MNECCATEKCLYEYCAMLQVWKTINFGFVKFWKINGHAFLMHLNMGFVIIVIVDDFEFDTECNNK